MSEDIQECLGDCNNCDEPRKDLCAIYQSQKRTFEMRQLMIEMRDLIVPFLDKMNKQNEVIQNLIIENSKLKKSVPPKVDKTNKN